MDARTRLVERSGRLAELRRIAAHKTADQR